MTITIVEETSTVLSEYFEISIGFLVESRFQVEAVKGGMGGFLLTEEKVSKPYLKDYDLDEGPGFWARQWDLKNWGVVSAHDGNVKVGGAVVAWKTPGVYMLEDGDDLAALWDLRIHPGHRRRGIGAELFDRAANWARVRGCRELKIETQNTNVPACRFYLSKGCELVAMNRRAYPDHPEETQLIWWRGLC